MRCIEHTICVAQCHCRQKSSTASDKFSSVRHSQVLALQTVQYADANGSTRESAIFPMRAKMPSWPSHFVLEKATTHAAVGGRSSRMSL